MWGAVLLLGLLEGLDPVRLGLTLLVLSRRRPVQNLLAYGAGSLTACIFTLVIPVMLLHGKPMFRSFGQGLAATSSTVRHIQIGMGVFALSMAALMTVRSLTRRRERADLTTPDGNTSTVVLDSKTPTAISRLLGRTEDAPTGGGSVIRRLLGRVHDAWESGSLWVAFVLGNGFSGTPPSVVLFVLAIIVPSGAAIGTQLSAVSVFVVGMLAIVEITLVSYLAMPGKTQAVLQLVHDWAWAHRRQVLVAMCTVGGVTLVARGMGGI
jgi:hypothetical protein